jgi:hypothetical protein
MAGKLKGSLFDGQYRAVTPEILQLQQVIQDTYYAQLAEYDHTPHRPGPKAKDDFLQAAFLVKSLKLDPVEFTCKQVMVMAASGNIFTTGVPSRKLMMKWPKESDSYRDGLSYYRAQWTAFQGFQATLTPQQLLRDRSQPFTPLFRACMALHYKLADVVSEYRAKARLELATNPAGKDLFATVVGQL